MANRTSWVITAIIAANALLSAGCMTKAPEVRVLSDQQAADLWSRAASYQAVGAAEVRRTQTENGVNVTCSQAYSMLMRGGGSGTTVTVCGGTCLLKSGGTFGACVTSGCMPSGGTCTPLVCSGSCTLSSSCRAEATIGVFGGGIFAE
jgi:hypothetical protein